MNVNGTISGVSNLTKAGAGTLTFGGSNSYSGVTMISAGTLLAANVNALAGTTLDTSGAGTMSFGTLTAENLGALQGPNNLALANASAAALTLTLGGANVNTIFNGNLTGGGALIKVGSGTQVLAGSNSYAGGTTISAGNLQLGNGGTLGSLNTGSAITDNGTLAFNRTNTVTEGTDFTATAISGTGTLAQAGTGLLLLTSNNTYSGGTNISAGTLQIGNNTSTGSVGAGAIVNNGTLAISLSVANTFSNNVSGTGIFNTTQNGTNTLTLGGSNTITQSRLNIGGTGLTFANTTDVFTNSAWFNGSNESVYITSGANVTVNGVFYITQPDGNNTGNLFITGGTLTVTGDMQDARDSLYHVVQSGGVVNTAQLLSGQTYNGNNTGGTGYTQIYDLTGGQLIAGNIAGGQRPLALNLGGGTLTASASYTMTPNGGVTLTGTNGNVTIDTGTFTLGSAYGWTSTGGFTKVGTGTLTFTASNSYSGTTTINNGTVNFNAASTGGGALAVNTGGTGNLNGSATVGAITVGGGTLNVNSATTASSAAVNSGNMNVNAQMTYSGATTIGTGTIHLSQLAQFGSSVPTVFLDAHSLSTGAITTWNNLITGSAGNFVAGTNGTGGTVQAGGAAFNNQNVVHFNGGQILFNTNVNYANTTIFYVGALDGTQNARLVGGTNNNWLMGYWSAKQDTAFGGSFFGTGGGTATVAATTATHLYELTIASGGADALYSNGTLLGSSSGQATPNGLTLGGYSTGNGGEDSKGSIGTVLVFNSVLSSTDRAAVEAYLDYVWFGTGSPTSLSYQSNLLPTTTALSMTASGGLLDINGVSQTIGSLTGVSGATVALGGGVLTTGGANTSTTFAGSINDAGGTSSLTGGSLTKTGTGTFTLTGTNSYSGGTTVSSGTLQLGGAGQLGSSGNYAGSISLTGTLEYSSSAAQTLSGVISGGGTLIKDTSTSTLSLTGSSSFNGTTTINAGTLIVGVGGVGSIANSAVTINSGGTLKGSGTTGAVIVNSGGTLSPGNSPGTLNTGAETWNNGGHYTWEVNQVDNSATLQGVTLKGQNPGYDWLNSSGSLTINSGFNLDITGLNTSSVSGNVNNWNPHNSYQWTIATASSISGTASSAITLTTTNFTNNNSIGGGTFSLTQDSTNVYLNFAGSTSAANAYWDINGTTAGAGGATPSGTWSTAATNWNYLADGTGTTFGWTNGDNAVFSAGTDATGTFTATISGGVTAQNITVEEGNVTIAGSTLTLAGTTPTITSSTPMTISSVIADTAAAGLTKAGTGTLSLTGINTYTGGTTISTGTLQIASAGSLGSGSYAGNIFNSGTFQYSSSAAQTLSGNISGGGVLIKDTSSSTLTLTGSNSYSGGFHDQCGHIPGRLRPRSVGQFRCHDQRRHAGCLRLR